MCFFLIIIQHTHSKHTVMPVSPDPPRSPPEWFRNIWTLPNFGFGQAKLQCQYFIKLCYDIRQQFRAENSRLFSVNNIRKISWTIQFPVFSCLLSTFPVLQNYFRIFQTTTSSDISSLSEFLSIKGIFISTSHITMVSSSYQEIKKKFIIF